MKTSTFKKIAVLVVLLLVLFSGSGCCTVELLMAAGHARNAHSVRERTASISEEKSTLAINIKEKIYHFYYPVNKPPSRESNKQYQLKYPLKSAPFFVKRYQLIADVDENASRISFRNFNCKHIAYEETIFSDGWKYTKYIDRPDTDFPMAYIELNQDVDINRDSVFHLRLHKDDLSCISKPFIIKNYYIPPHKDYKLNREDLMIPYKVDGNRYYLYSDTGRRDIFKVSGQGGYERKNPFFYLYSCIFTPPALVIDIVGLPFELIGAAVIGMALSSALGP